MSFTKTGEFSALVFIEMSVLMLSLQARGSQLDVHPLFRCWLKSAWAPVAAWPVLHTGPLLLLCTQRVPEPNCKGGTATSDGKVGSTGL